MHDDMEKLCVVLLVVLFFVYCWGCDARNRAYDEGYTDAEEHYVELMDEMRDCVYWFVPEDLDRNTSEMSRDEIVDFYYRVYCSVKENMTSIYISGRDDSYSPSWKNERYD